MGKVCYCFSYHLILAFLYRIIADFLNKKIKEKKENKEKEGKKEIKEVIEENEEDKNKDDSKDKQQIRMNGGNNENLI